MDVVNLSLSINEMVTTMSHKIESFPSEIVVVTLNEKFKSKSQTDNLKITN